MIIVGESNGRAIAQGVGNIPVPDLTERKKAMGNPAESHNIVNLGNAIGLNDLDVRMRPMLARDTAFTRQRRGRFYDQLLSVAVNPLGGAIAKARKIGANNDLKDEVRAKRVAEALEEAWPETERRLAAIEDESRKAVQLAEAVYRVAWTLPEDTDMNLQELRDREVRDVLRGMDKTERLSVVMEAAKDGRLDLFRQLEADPMGQLGASLPNDTLDRAKALALDKAGLSWVQVMRDDAKADQEHIAVMVQLLKDGITADLRRAFGARANLTNYKEAA